VHAQATTPPLPNANKNVRQPNAREHLLADPNARRAHLRQQEFRLDRARLPTFGDDAVTSLALLLARDQPMDEAERAAFATLCTQLTDDPLRAEFAETPAPPSWADEQAIAGLVERYKAQQRTRGAKGQGVRLGRVVVLSAWSSGASGAATVDQTDIRGSGPHDW
jgi:hypothetical protein